MIKTVTISKSTRKSRAAKPHSLTAPCNAQLRGQHVTALNKYLLSLLMYECKQKSYLSIKIEVSTMDEIILKYSPESNTNHLNLALNEREEFIVAISLQNLLNDHEIVGNIFGLFPRLH